MAAVTSDQFRLDFTEFSSTSQYPGNELDFWLNVAEKLVNQSRWGDLYPVAIELFAAHNIVLEARARKEGANGKVPGFSQGVLTSKSVDKVSAGYDAGSAMEENAGHWNLTIYGARYIRLARLHGAGPLQVGAPGAGCNVSAYGAWAGPFVPWF